MRTGGPPSPSTSYWLRSPAIAQSWPLSCPLAVNEWNSSLSPLTALQLLHLWSEARSHEKEAGPSRASTLLAQVPPASVHGAGRGQMCRAGHFTGAS